MNYLLEFLKIIPQNKVVSYSFLAKVFNLHPRQVANILKSNQQQDLYPCYKVVNVDGSLGGYNLGIAEKIRRLQKDGISIENDKVSSEFFWKPKVKNFFVAFPLESEEKYKFKKMYYELKNIQNGSFTLQSFKSPHITLRFFGDIGFEKMYQIINKVKNSDFLKDLPDDEITFDKIGNFNNRVWFFENIDKLDLFTTIYEKFLYIVNLQQEERGYHPHLTVARVKDMRKFPKREFLSIVGKYRFKLKINKFRFYAAFDNVYQVPICDLNSN